MIHMVSTRVGNILTVTFRCDTDVLWSFLVVNMDCWVGLMCLAIVAVLYCHTEEKKHGRA